MKILTILGPAKSLPDDIIKYGIVGDVMAVNRAIIDYHKNIKYAVCLHPGILDVYTQYRKLIGCNWEDVIAVSDLPDYKPAINTSGLLALCKAVAENYDEIRVLGISADDSGHYYDLPNTQVQDYSNYFPYENDEWIPVLKSWTNIKVASGNLTKIFTQL